MKINKNKQLKQQIITDVFLDLDHTIWDFDRNSELAFKRVFKKHNIAIDIEVFLKAYIPVNFNYWKLFREEKITKQQLRRGRLIDSFASLNKVYEINEIDAISDSYIQELPGNNYLLDGALEILKYLSSKYKLHIITNGFQEVQVLKLQKSGIAHYFKTVTSSEEVGVKKPNPKVFLTALQKANVAAFQSCMIGDTFEADILGGEGIGMSTIFYNYHKVMAPSHYKIVYHLLEIKKYL